jgi:hypothetical protein
MKNSLIFSAICILLLFYSCTKESLPTSEQSLRPEKISVMPGLLLSAAEDRSGVETSCDNIPAEANFVSIRYLLDDGSISPPLCFTESELKNILLNAELSESQVNDYMERLFIKDEAATPELAYEVGAYIAVGYELPPEYLPSCYSINALGRLDYPGESSSGGGCVPGFIDRYTIRQARASGGCQLLLEEGFSGIRLKNKSTGEIVTYAFSSSLEDFTEPLIASGLSFEQAEAEVQRILCGNYSVREVWNLFQFRIAPQLSSVQNIPEAELDEWKLWHVGIGIYAANGSAVSFYFVQGSAPLNCSAVFPLHNCAPSVE